MFIMILLLKSTANRIAEEEHWIIPPRRVTWYTRTALSAVRAGTKKNQNREKERTNIAVEGDGEYYVSSCGGERSFWIWIVPERTCDPELQSFCASLSLIHMGSY